MTQVKRAQANTGDFALHRQVDGRTLAQRRAAFAAQMRDMALSDLSQVSRRLKELHEELERKEGCRWTHYKLAAAMDIPPRTFQAWENGENENRDGKGYDKMARWYSRRLGRKITRQWILFGEEIGQERPGTADEKGEDPFAQLSAPDAKRIAKGLADLQEEVAGVAGRQESAAALLEQLAEDVRSLRADVAILKRRRAG